jgi:ankyrin repeat protein
MELTDDFNVINLTHALVECARAGDAKAVQELLEKGAPVNGQDYFGTTALIIAASEGHADVVKVLLAQPGIEVDEKNKSSGSTALAMAAYKGHVDIIELLVAAGANINETDDGNNTPLMYAAQQGHAAAAQKLTDLGAALGMKNIAGCTALSLAEVKNGTDCTEVIAILKEAERKPHVHMVMPEGITGLKRRIAGRAP